MSAKSNKLPEGWARCKKHGLYMKPSCSVCGTEARRISEGKCIARLWHGPGHQSSTFCQAVGEHKIHKAYYGSFGGFMQWKGKKAFTGFFDEPKELKGS